jgi:flavin reductase (DIM6/NTAB) family NADH-FMN oxidoreductase RutF
MKITMPIDVSEFKRALGKWPSGVTVVTASEGTRLHGMTASSFASVSLDPRLISVCLDLATNTLELVRASQCFAINVLAKSQATISTHFASKATESDRFRGIEYQVGANGCPLIVGAVAQLECRVFAAHAAGDHVLLIGEVERVSVTDGDPLLYFDRRYGEFSPQ